MSVDVSHSIADPARAEAIDGNLLATPDRGALCLMLSVGHRTGLFDVMAGLPPVTSEGLAAEASLNERYVRVWPGAMVTAGIIEIDPESLRHTLPHEHAAFLTRATAADNMAVFTQGGEGLGAMWGEEKPRNYLQKAGFSSIITHSLAHDIQNHWYIVMK